MAPAVLAGAEKAFIQLRAVREILRLYIHHKGIVAEAAVPVLVGAVVEAAAHLPLVLLVLLPVVMAVTDRLMLFQAYLLLMLAVAVEAYKGLEQ